MLVGKPGLDQGTHSGAVGIRSPPELLLLGADGMSATTDPRVIIFINDAPPELPSRPRKSLLVSPDNTLTPASVSANDIRRTVSRSAA